MHLWQRLALVALICSIFYMGSVAVHGSNRSQSQQKVPLSEAGDRTTETLWRPSTWEPITFFTCVLVLVGASQAALFFWQLGLIRDNASDSKLAADAAKQSADSLIAGGRAFVFCKRCTFGTTSNNTIWVGPEWGNSGNTPTVSLRTRVSCQIFDTDIPDDFDFSAAIEACKESQAFLGPRMSILGARLPIDGISHRDLDLTKTRQKFIYLFGQARYLDIFDKRHEHLTEFFFRIEVWGDPTVQSSFGIGFVPQARYNRAYDQVLV